MMKRQMIFILLIVVCAFVVYSNAVENSFVHDDAHFIVNNEYIKDLSEWPLYFTDEHTISPEGHDIYRPFRTLSFALDYRMFKLKPNGFHMINIIIHILNSILVFLVVSKLFERGGFSKEYDSTLLSLFSALIFALHPIQTETVAWVSCRGDLLFALFSLGAVYFYLLSKDGAYSQKHRYVFFAAALAMFVFGLLSKETAIMLPLALLLVEWYCGEPLMRWDRSRVKRYIAFAAIIFPYMLVRLAVVGKLAQRAYYGGGIFDTLLTMVIAYGKYFRLVLFPYDMHVVYTINVPETVFEVHFVLAFLAILLVILLALIFKEIKIIPFSLLWFLIYMFPTSNVVPFKGIMTEHFLYLPLLGLCMLTAVFIGRLYSGKYKVFALTLFIALLAIYASMVMERNEDWYSNYSLWMSELENAPIKSFQAYTGVGIELGKVGRYEESIVNLKKAIDLNPEYNIPHYAISLSYAGLEPPDIALSKKHAVIAAFLGCRINPGFVEYLQKAEDAQREQTEQ